jgi:hypothetical protein
VLRAALVVYPWVFTLPPHGPCWTPGRRRAPPMSRGGRPGTLPACLEHRLGRLNTIRVRELRRSGPPEVGRRPAVGVALHGPDGLPATHRRHRSPCGVDGAFFLRQRGHQIFVSLVRLGRHASHTDRLGRLEVVPGLDLRSPGALRGEEGEPWSRPSGRLRTLPVSSWVCPHSA